MAFFGMSRDYFLSFQGNKNYVTNRFGSFVYHYRRDYPALSNKGLLMAKYNKNSLTPFHQKVAISYIKQLINDPDTCEILRKKLKKQLKKKATV